MFESLFSQNGLSLERMRGFLEMAEAGSIAGAAPGDVVRQSLISRQIRELEEFFSAELTIRKGKTLALAPEGVRLAAIIREQFQTLEDFRSVQVNVPRVFTLCAGASTLEWMVTPFLTDLARVLGGVQLRTEMRRSRPLVEAVREGSVDLGIVRRDAIPDPSRKNCEPIVELSFHLCVPKQLLPRKTTPDRLSDTATWQDLPFAAGRDGGQLDGAIRDAMERLGVSFRPRFECGSMLQVRSLVQQGGCAAILPNVALSGLDPNRVFSIPFRPLAGYGRTLVLHWNPRQMNRRDVSLDTLRDAAQVLAAAVPEAK
jgi:DNA-binding transcriptional LysR family regulator